MGNGDDVLADALEALATATAAQVLVTEALHEDAREVVRVSAERYQQVRDDQRTQRRRSYVALAVIAGFAIALLILASINRQTLTTVKDCIEVSTDPKTCYARSRRESAKVVASIVDTNRNGIADNAEILAKLNQIKP